MRKVVEFLHFTSRVLALCAVLAGLAAGIFKATFIANLICADSCPTPAFYFSYLGPATVWLLAPCVALEILALAAFLAYCVATRQARRAVMSLLFLLVGGLLGVAALDALLKHAQATLPVDEGGLLVEAQVFAWEHLWGLAFLLVAGAWSGVLAYLQWRR